MEQLMQAWGGAHWATFGWPLLAAHLLADFVLQTDWMVARKRRVGVLALHALIVTVVAYVCLGRWGHFAMPLTIGASHFLIDAVKVRLKQPGMVAFVVDQLAHLLVLLVVINVWGELLFLEEYRHRTEPAGAVFWTVLCGLIVCVNVGGVVIGYWVKPYLDELRVAPTPGGALGVVRGLTNGGRTIGQWERALIFLLVGVGQPGAIGFLIAAKSIFRFGELKDRENRMEAEYITIGTLMSFGWAAATAYGTWWLVRG